MIGRFCHYFPGYTVEKVLSMPFIRFITLNNTIGVIQAGDDLRLLNIIFTANHPGDKGKNIKNLTSSFEKILGHDSTINRKPVMPGITQGVTGMDKQDVEKSRSEREQKIKEWEEKRESFNASKV